MDNSIELASSGLTSFLQKHNTSFRLSGVRYLATQWISSLAASDSIAYIYHILKVEETLKESD